MPWKCSVSQLWFHFWVFTFARTHKTAHFKWVKYVNYTSVYLKKKMKAKKFQFSCQQTIFKSLPRSLLFQEFTALLLNAIRWQHYFHNLVNTFLEKTRDKNQRDITSALVSTTLYSLCYVHSCKETLAS